MIPTLILCATLCAATCMWVFAPVRARNRFLASSLLCAALSLVIYMALGAPGLPPSPPQENSEAANQLRQEAEFMLMLNKNPDDSDALIRLAALRLLQGRAGPETEKLLTRAEAIAPEDKRITTLRKILNTPLPDQ